ncbi:hypothetical protein AA106555_1662 [Neokomagataea thailandica NBRC 106555]|uniref:OmpA-like domain-containing protein n=2 Tax=Neokomagataea TaxID=1223423 RepID=A0A4Y6V6B6_9PROT|nr:MULTISPECIES: OmpA family protein [Neokomagataea]QDH25692.1 hypothetical protein D5366_11255 [Neokomagataea tanensis]GBR54411.1 hypothetical protein AA106555_1662 [Neokomagataea thailandica NBRC 106555]
MVRTLMSSRRFLARSFLPAFALTAALSACSTGDRDSYVVFFDREDAVMSTTGQAIVAKAAHAALKENASNIRVAGSSGQSGDPDTLKQLASDRAKTVAAQLAADGIDTSKITITTDTTTDVDASHVAYRRVSITITPGL